MRLAAAVGPLLLLLALLALPARARAQAAGGVGQPEVVDISFEGNQVVPEDSLEAAIVNRQTECKAGIFKVFPPLCPLGLDFAIDRHYLVPRELPRDAVRLEVYYYLHGYREAQVDTSTTRTSSGGRDQVAITFHIDEGRPVRIDSLAFTGLEDVAERDEVLRGLPVEKGDPLSGILLDATRDTLVSRLEDRGYAHVDVLRNLFIPNETPYRAEVEYDVAAGPRARFGDIDIGWPQTDDPQLTDALVRRMLPFSEGDVYSRDQIFQAQRNLFGLEIIQSASIERDTLSPVDSLVPLRIRIAEADAHRVRLGTGWSMADCLNAESQWTSRNFYGGARRLQARARLSNVLANELHDVACQQSGVGKDFGGLNWSTSLELFQPWLFGPRNSFTASVFWERQSLADIFVREAKGANLAVTRTLGDRMPLTVAYRPQYTSLEAADVFFCTSFLVCTPEDIDVLQGAQWLAPVGLNLTRSRTDNVLNPSRGYQLLLDVEHAGTLTGSDFGYDRVIAEADRYVELARRTVFAGRLRVGWIGSGEFGGLEQGTLEVIHPQKRFYAGGANSVRGFAQNRLGPRVLTVNVRNLLGAPAPGEAPVCTPGEVMDLTCDPDLLDDGAFDPRPTGGTRVVEGSVEYRFAFGGEFQGVGFLDFGQVWAEGDAVRPGDLEWAPGVGVRYFSPIGPIRVDLGYRFRGGEVLSVVTSRIRPYVEGEDDPGSRICVVPGTGYGDVAGDACGDDAVRIPWVRRDELGVLQQGALYDALPSFSLQRFQLHLSIGQAF